MSKAIIKIAYGYFHFSFALFDQNQKSYLSIASNDGKKEDDDSYGVPRGCSIRSVVSDNSSNAIPNVLQFGFIFFENGYRQQKSFLQT